LAIQIKQIQFKPYGFFLVLMLFRRSGGEKGAHKSGKNFRKQEKSAPLFVPQLCYWIDAGDRWGQIA
jgi:hypothetical protein